MRAAALLALGLTAGCDLLRDPVEVPFTGEEIMVHSVLEAGADSVLVRIVRVRGTGSGAPRVEPVSGATVEIRSAGVRLRLEEAESALSRCRTERSDPYSPHGQPTQGDARGCYVAHVPGAIQPGEPYNLQVTISGQPEIRGRAVVPPAPVIHEPAGAVRLALEAVSDDWWRSAPLSVRWSTPEEVATVGLAVQPDAIFEQGREVGGARCEVMLVDEAGRLGTGADVERADSASLRAVLTNCIEYHDGTPVRRVEPDSVQARLRAVAYDTAFARYQKLVGDESVRRERASVGLSGALGVFAGAAVAEQGVVLITPPEE